MIDIDWEATGRADIDYPDWENDKAYPKGEELSPPQWGWEFLRRNPCYCYAWAFDQLRPEEYGLSEALDPSISPFDPAIAVPVPKAGRVYVGPDERVPVLASGEAAIMVDLSLPLEQQVAVAMASLRRQRPKTHRRLRRDKYPHYIRVWDGKRANATLAQIGCLLYPHHDDVNQKDKVKTDLKTAEELIFDRYFFLLNAQG